LNLIKELKEKPNRGNLMPSLFIGHGSPMNGIEDNQFSQTWASLGKTIPLPKAVVVISAHWLTKGTLVTAMDFPKTIHDFGGFPPELYQVQYPAPGDPALAQEVKRSIHSADLQLDHEWGLDHGTWTVVRHMYPKADIPIIQVSIDYGKDLKYHFNLAKELGQLRKKGVLIIGSGNMVHNLRMVAWDKLNEPSFGFDWALEMNERFKERIINHQIDDLIHYGQLGKEASLAIPTPDHYIPLIYQMGLKQGDETIEFFNDMAVGGSLTMTSVRFG
jgi:4,5-DOPA dioxygenase extradiol